VIFSFRKNLHGWLISSSSRHGSADLIVRHLEHRGCPWLLAPALLSALVAHANRPKAGPLCLLVEAEVDELALELRPQAATTKAALR
jgi:hypothetical protein